MEAPEVPLEKSQDHINEHAKEAGEKWIMGVALSTAVLAAIAAIASMLAGAHINEGLISQIKASDNWAYYQAKGIKAGVLDAKIELLRAEGKQPNADDTAKAERYAQEQDKLSDDAKELEKESAEHVERHEKLASSVTLFQIAIAISAISVLTRRPHFWFVGLASGCAGLVFFVLAYTVPT